MAGQGTQLGVLPFLKGNFLAASFCHATDRCCRCGFAEHPSRLPPRFVASMNFTVSVTDFIRLLPDSSLASVKLISTGGSCQSEWRWQWSGVGYDLTAH